METPRWFDTHVHLDRYPASERRALLRRARAAGVLQMLAVGTDLASSRATLALRAPVVKAVGVHPLRGAEGVSPEFARLVASRDVVAVGEIGFDEAGPHVDVQAQVFQELCSLARGNELAVVLHLVGLWQELRQNADALLGLRAVRHYFTGDEEQAAWHRERGHFLSFGRPLLRESNLQAVAARYPAELLLVETDSYPLAGRCTEPRDLPAAGAALAALRGWSPEQAAAVLWDNSRRAFGLR